MSLQIKETLLKPPKTGGETTTHDSGGCTMM